MNCWRFMAFCLEWFNKPTNHWATSYTCVHNERERKWIREKERERVCVCRERMVLVIIIRFINIISVYEWRSPVWLKKRKSDEWNRKRKRKLCIQSVVMIQSKKYAQIKLNKEQNTEINATHITFRKRKREWLSEWVYVCVSPLSHIDSENEHSNVNHERSTIKCYVILHLLHMSRHSLPLAGYTHVFDWSDKNKSVFVSCYENQFEQDTHIHPFFFIWLAPFCNVCIFIFLSLSVSHSLCECVWVLSIWQNHIWQTYKSHSTAHHRLMFTDTRTKLKPDSR